MLSILTKHSLTNCHSLAFSVSLPSSLFPAWKDLYSKSWLSSINHYAPWILGNLVLSATSSSWKPSPPLGTHSWSSYEYLGYHLVFLFLTLNDRVLFWAFSSFPSVLEFILCIQGYLQMIPIFYPPCIYVLFNVTLQLLLSRGRIYFSASWIWTGLDLLRPREYGKAKLYQILAQASHLDDESLWLSHFGQ